MGNCARLTVASLVLAGCVHQPPAPPAPAPAVPAVTPAPAAPPTVAGPTAAAPAPGATSPPPTAPPPARKSPPPQRSASIPKPAPPPPAAPLPPPRAPALDLGTLEERLRSTKAIGVFTKLSLKNEVDGLLEQFRQFHQAGVPPLPQLRQRYDLLLMKVLSLLQDGDPALATAIGASREAIWAVLVDPKSFAKLAA